jgi:DNA-binding transcriptional ArsR family regulator
MSLGDADRDRVVSLRAMAHPVRLRMLSLLTGAPMSAAEVARELDLTHANASYHLRQLLAAGQIVEAGEETIRGGRAKRYRYDVDVPGATTADAGERGTFFKLLADELLRRSSSIHPASRQSSTDAELWVDLADWATALDQVTEAMTLLHRAAKPRRSDGTVHISATVSMFVMDDGPDAGSSYRPDDNPAR